MSVQKISLLPEEVSRKIAAGEVIERPFSAVKELVENSLDAGATEIVVEIQDGGKKSIRVHDNGSGMSREDAALCLERHATSKISTASDLLRISTLGFRGEALASIAAVSHLVLKTFDGQGEIGTQVERKGGELISVQDIAFPRGTRVEVRDLFFNLPARRKFLRSDKAEAALILRWMTAMALAYPGVRFLVVHGQREVLNCPAVGSVAERLFQLFGKEALHRLVEVDFREGAHLIYGYASRPPSGRPDRAHQLFFVNGRLVKDRLLQAALQQAYRGYLEKDSYPEAYLFLSIPASDVDVNVHPAKAEVRFRDSQFVFYLLLRAVESSLLQQKGVKEIYPISRGPLAHPRVEESVSPGIYEEARERDGRETGELFSAREEGAPAGPRVLGQYLDSYIIAAAPEGLLIIDQHNAHERVLFERYRAVDAEKRWPERAPLIPVLFDLSPSQELSFEDNREFLESMGFRVEAMGGRSYALQSFPDIFEEEEAKETLLALLEAIEGEEALPKREKALATLACRTAVKAGQTLNREKMDYLVEELFRTSNPSLCPHGRPVLLRLDKSQIERGLKRTT